MQISLLRLRVHTASVFCKYRDDDKINHIAQKPDDKTAQYFLEFFTLRRFKRKRQHYRHKRYSYADKRPAMFIQKAFHRCQILFAGMIYYSIFPAICRLQIGIKLRLNAFSAG